MGEMMQELKPIHNDAEYESALAEASLYFDREPTPGTKKAIVLRCYCC
jgi:antitoxin component HigA of HigAB toxin-antitoxin module